MQGLLGCSRRPGHSLGLVMRLWRRRPPPCQRCRGPRGASSTRASAAHALPLPPFRASCEHPQSRFRRPVKNPEQGSGSACWSAFALLPVSDRLVRYIDAACELPPESALDACAPDERTVPCLASPRHRHRALVARYPPPSSRPALLNKSEEWEHEAWGTPVGAAHLGFAISVFPSVCWSTRCGWAPGSTRKKAESVHGSLALRRLSHRGYLKLSS